MLQFNEQGQIIVPPLIRQDLDEQKEANEMGLTISQFRKLKEQTEKQNRRNMHATEVEIEIQKHMHISVKKVDDQELEEYHARGFSDKEIAKVFKCNPTSVWMGRAKKGLVANYPAPYGLENLTPDELHERYRQRIEGRFSVSLVAEMIGEGVTVK